MRLGLLIAVVGTFAVPAATRGQVPAACGDLSELADSDTGYRQVFTEPEYQWLREANGFETLSQEVSQSRVLNEGECTKIQMALREHLWSTVGRSEEGRNALRDGYRFLIYHIGPYYVVPVQPTDPAGMAEEGYEIVNVFLAATLEFVGDYLN